MATITGTEFKAILNLASDTAFSTTNAEYTLDQAINTLNLYLAQYDMEIPNLTGIAGAKTLTVDTKTKAAVYLVAGAAYSNFFKASGSGSSSTSTTLGPLSTSQSASSSSSTGAGTTTNVQAIAREAAAMLKDQSVEAEVA